MQVPEGQPLQLRVAVDHAVRGAGEVGEPGEFEGRVAGWGGVRWGGAGRGGAGWGGAGRASPGRGGAGQGGPRPFSYWGIGTLRKITPIL